MSEARGRNPKKRRYPEQDPPEPEGTSQYQKRKLDHPRQNKSEPPAAFWDSLSKVWLTKRALKELDRRNAQSARHPPSSHRRFRRPFTRLALAEFKKGCPPLIPASKYLSGHCTAERLREIKSSARLGGQNLSDLRGCPEPADPLHRAMSQSSISSSRSRSRRRRPAKSNSQTILSRKSSAYDRDFEQNLIDHGIYPHAYEHPDGRVISRPYNWEEINRKLTQRRSSLSPSVFTEEAFTKFIRADAHAFKEQQVTTSVMPIIEGEIRDARCAAGGIPFNNLDPLTDGKLVPANPDIFYGARPEQLDRQIREELSSRIIPSTETTLPILPNFFTEVKGPDGSLAVAGRQLLQDLASGVRGMQCLQSHGQPEPTYDNNAYTIGTIYHGGTLKIFTQHPIQPTSAGSHPEHYTNQIRSFAMTDSAETFRQGAAWYRNGIDLAREWRDEIIEAANGRMQSMQAESQSLPSSGLEENSTSVTGAVRESDTSEDELALDQLTARSLGKRRRMG